MNTACLLIVCVLLGHPAIAAPPDITVPDGFDVALLHEATEAEGSWSAMTIDGDGRLIISPQAGPLLRVTVPDGPAGSSRIERLHEHIGSAQGLLALGHDLYVNVAKEPDQDGGLWRLRDLDGDDRYEIAERLAAYGSRSEHGPHGLVLGPDGHLWMVNGNYTSLPEGCRSSSPFVGWAEDDVLERIWDPRGHAHGIQVPAGVLLRTDLEGREWEVMAGGMRNPYDLDFNRDGELFTYDADMEWDMGTPWYRTPRFLHLVSGAEYGWRSGSSKWPVNSPDAFPAVLEMDAGSPTGVASGHRSNFPPPWDRSMFLGDWAYGRILAVELEAKGGTYDGDVRTFLTGRPLNVTDFDFCPKGDLYLITGGRGSQSRLYRVRWTGDDVPESIDFDREASLTRDLRRRLDGSHVSPGSIDVDTLIHNLGDRDVTVRHAARVGLEHWMRNRLVQDGPAGIGDAWSRLEDLPPDEGGWEAILACIHTVDASRASDLALWLHALSLDDDTVAGHLWFGRLAGVWAHRFGVHRSEPSDGLRGRLREIFPTGDFQTDRHLAEAIVALGGEGRGGVLLGSSGDLSSPLEIMHRLHAVSQLDGDWSAEYDGTIVNLLVEVERSTGGASYEGYVGAIRDRITPHLDEESTARLASSLVSRTRDSTEDSARRTVRNWSVEDVEPHLSRVLAGRNHARGRAMYEALQCAACHQVGDHGIAYGPDLTAAGGRFGLRDLLVATLEPERDISDQYEALLIETGDDRHLGLVVERDDQIIVLAADPRLGQARREIAVDSVLRETVASPMPRGLLDTAELDEILDLLAYLVSAGDPSDAVFLPQP